MTDQPVKRINGAQVGLIVFGAVALLGGITASVLLYQAAVHQSEVLQYENALLGDLSDVVPDPTGMWIGIIVAVLGVVMLIAAVVIAGMKQAPIN